MKSMNPEAAAALMTPNNSADLGALVQMEGGETEKMLQFSIDDEELFYRQ